MPELPEVETTVRELRTKVLGRTFAGVWTDFYRAIKIIRKGKVFKKGKIAFRDFKKEIKGREIKSLKRRGKNILLELSGRKTILVHLKMTGHFLYGKWARKKEKWISEIKGALLEDSMNSFLHLVFNLDNGCQLALSDLRKFAKAELWDTEDLEKSEYLGKLGPDPLSGKFTFKKFKERIKGKKGKIKKILQDQSVIAGIGNIYSDEILFAARVSPLREGGSLSEKELKAVFLGMKKILRKAVKAKGESFSDFRITSGEKGGFDKFIKIYRKEGKPCPVCGEKIKREKVGGRSAHFCPRCQK
jgi:formamidopyrimidine-DNA glycosylase